MNMIRANVSQQDDFSLTTSRADNSEGSLPDDICVIELRNVG